MASNAARRSLNPEAPLFIPSRLSSDLPTVFHVSTAPPASSFFLFNFFSPNFAGHPPLFSASHPAQAAENEAAACMINQFFDGRNGGGRRLRDKAKGKKVYRMKPRNGDCFEADDRKSAGRKLSRNERVKTVLPVRQDGSWRTVMIRNIPSKYTRELLLEFVDEHCKNENKEFTDRSSGDGEDDAVSAFDFLYLPIDFTTGMNKGYAFVNFTTAAGARRFINSADNQRWDLFNSNKIRQISRARLQGKEELVSHFQNIGFPCHSEELLPLCLTPPRDGSGKSVNQTTVGRLLGSRRKSWGRSPES